MKKNIKPRSATIIFVLTVFTVFLANRLFSFKLDSLIPTYKYESVIHKNTKDTNLKQEPFSRLDFIFNKENISFSKPKEKDYNEILKSEFYIPTMEMISRKITGLTEMDKDLKDRIYQSIQLGVNESGEQKYYIIYEYKENESIKNLIVEFAPKRGVQLFLCMERTKVNGSKYTKVILDNNFREKIISELVWEGWAIIQEKVTNSSLQELNFSTKNIISELNICYVQDNTSQFTFYYDMINESVIGFRKN